MIELLLTLSMALCEADITVARAAALIGAPQPRAGSLAPLVVTTNEANITHAEVVGDSDSAPPAYVRLTLAAAALTLDEMRDAFGEGSIVPRSRPDQGARWMFHVRPPSKPFECALIAEAAANGSSVHIVTLRRDQKL